MERKLSYDDEDLLRLSMHSSNDLLLAMKQLPDPKVKMNHVSQNVRMKSTEVHTRFKD
jgi:hypothetical protein